MTRVSCFLAFLLLTALITQAEQLPLRAYTSSDGLSQDRVKRIVLDSRGFLSFCTADGLSRFDGIRFTTYDVARGLNYPSVKDFLETSDGKYWVATNGGGVFLFVQTLLSPAFAPAINQMPIKVNRSFFSFR